MKVESLTVYSTLGSTAPLLTLLWNQFGYFGFNLLGFIAISLQISDWFIYILTRSSDYFYICYKGIGAH